MRGSAASVLRVTGFAAVVLVRVAAQELFASTFRIDGKITAPSALVYVDSEAPRVSWSVGAVGSPSSTQSTGYRLVASRSRSSYENGHFDAWDSGLVGAGDTVHVPYGGRGLEDVGGSVYLGIFAFDSQQLAAPEPSGPLILRRAPARGAPWAAGGAVWLGRTAAPWPSDCAQYADDPEPLFRLPVSTAGFSGGVTAADLFITGLGWFRAFINGDRVGDAFLEPAWTTYSRRTLYAAYDVTAALSGAGPEAVLGVSLGKGWRDPLPMRLFGQFDVRDALPVGRAAFIAWLRVVDGSGRTHNFTSSLGSGWRVGAGPVLRNNVYLGEAADLRVLQSPAAKGWALPGFNASEWGAPVLANTSAIGPLELQRAPPIRVTGSFAPTAVQPTPGTAAGTSYTLTFPLNMAGVVELRGIVAPTGWNVTLTFAEILFPNGTIDTSSNIAGLIGAWQGGNWGPCARVPALEIDSVTFSGDATGESYAPHWSWHAFRYVQVDNWPFASHGPPSATNFAALRFHVDNLVAGTFNSWSPLLNAVEAGARESFRSNWAGGIQSDCPGRERLGYGADMMLSADAAMMQFDAGAFYAKRVNDYADAARPNGALPETAPYIGIGSCDTLGDNAGPMAWGAAHSDMQVQMWPFYGDSTVMRDNFVVLQKWMALLNERAGTTHLLDSGLPDFTQIGVPCNSTMMTLQGTAFFYSQARNAERIATILNASAYAAEMASLASSVATAFQDYFIVAGPNGSVVIGDGSLDVTSWALFLGLVPEAQQSIRAAIRANGTHMFTGSMATSFLFRQGVRWGLSDILYESLAQVDFPSYGYWLSLGATSLLEHWDNGGSWNHAWLGSVGSFFYHAIGGISCRDDMRVSACGAIDVRPYPPQLESSGAAAITVAVGSGAVPAPASLPFANVSYSSVRGLVSSFWAYGSDAARGNMTFTMSVTFPANVLASVAVPVWVAGIAASSVAVRACERAAGPTVDPQGFWVYTLDFTPPDPCEFFFSWPADGAGP